MVLRIEAGVRARAGVEQRLRRPHEAVRSCAVEPEISRETEVGQRIPTARASLRRGVPRIEREEPAHGRIVAENRRRMDVAARDLGVRRQDRLGALECAGSVPAVEWNTCGLDEGRQRIADVDHVGSHTVNTPSKTAQLKTVAPMLNRGDVSTVRRPVLFRWSDRDAAESSTRNPGPTAQRSVPSSVCSMVMILNQKCFRPSGSSPGTTLPS